MAGDADRGAGGGEDADTMRSGTLDTLLRRYVVALGLLLLIGCTTQGVVGSLPPLPDPEQAAEVIVIREWRFIGGGANVTVVLDGAPIYGIASRNTLSCESRLAIASSPSRDAGRSSTTLLPPFVPSPGAATTID